MLEQEVTKGAIMEKKDEDYYNHTRFDILKLIPSTAQQILSVGCGNGSTEVELLKQGHSVVGLELNADAAETARKKGLEVIVADAFLANQYLNGRQFDCLIYADMLEHVSDPQALLAKHMQLLKPGGAIVISVPNFRHYEVFKQLFLYGMIRYEDAGILDKTHIRITTRKMVEMWLEKINISVDKVVYKASRRRELYIMKVVPAMLKEYFARQIIVKGSRL